MQVCPSPFTLPPAAQQPSLSLRLYLHITSLPSLQFEKNSRAGLSICHRGLQPLPLSLPTHTKPHQPAPPWLCPEHQSKQSFGVCQNTDSASPSSETSDPICIANSLPGLFCLSLLNTCYLNSKSFFWGLTVSLLFLEFTHYISNSATLFVCC